MNSQQWLPGESSPPFYGFYDPNDPFYSLGITPGAGYGGPGDLQQPIEYRSLYAPHQQPQVQGHHNFYFVDGPTSHPSVSANDFMALRTTPQDSSSFSAYTSPAAATNHSLPNGSSSTSRGYIHTPTHHPPTYHQTNTRVLPYHYQHSYKQANPYPRHFQSERPANPSCIPQQPFIPIPQHPNALEVVPCGPPDFYCGSLERDHPGVGEYFVSFSTSHANFSTPELDWTPQASGSTSHPGVRSPVRNPQRPRQATYGKPYERTNESVTVDKTRPNPSTMSPLIVPMKLPQRWTPPSSNTGNMEAPESPKIPVIAIKVPGSSRFPANRKPETSIPARKQPSSYVSQGFGPSEDIELQVLATSGIKMVERTGRPEIILPGPDSYWRCRWSGCREMVPAKMKMIKDHMQSVHGVDLARSGPRTVNGEQRFQCRWEPAMLVELPDGRQVFVSSHEHRYVCGFGLKRSSLVKHIATHLRHEHQPNPQAVTCKCGKVIIDRGSHVCEFKEKGKRSKLVLSA